MNYPIQSQNASETERILRKLSSSLTQTACETASAFFSVNTTPGPKWNTQVLNDLGSLHCSQRNIGDRFEMTCNLAVEKRDWDRMFPALESERLKMDTFCELANCISGSILAQGEFIDSFGNMIPCVPFAMAARASAGSKTLRGAFRLSGILIYFSFTILDSRSSQADLAKTCSAQSYSVAA